MLKQNLFALTALSLGFAANAQSDQENIEIITVNADFQSQTLNEIPQSIAIVDPQTMQERSAEHLQNVLNSVANINFSGGTSTARFIQIRGIGERSQFVDNVNPSVGLLIDGIDYSGLGAAATLFDIGQLEVFRGPQSGRFGVNSLAGMVVLESEAPSAITQGRLLAGMANYDEQRLGVAVGGALGEATQARLSVLQFNQDGFTSNAFLDRDDTEQRDELSARLGLSSALSDDWQVNANLHYFNIDNGYDAFSLENDRVTLSDQPGSDALRSAAVRLAAVYSGWGASELELSVSRLNADSEYSFDEDWTYVGIAPGWEYSSFDAYFRDREDTTVEGRLRSTEPVTLLGLMSEWTLGVYAYRKNQQLTRDYFNWDIGAPALFSSDQERNHWALYGELIQQLNTRWSLLTGLRLERYTTDYLDSNQVAEEPSDTMIGGNLSLRYQYTDNSRWYTTLARGYKAGGVNGEALGRAKDQQLESIEQYLLERATFAPELLWNLESGLKWASPNQGWTGRVAVFYNWRDDVQLKSWVNRDQSFVGFLENAASGTNYGVEAELEGQLTDGLSAFASLGWLNTEIDGFVTEDGEDMSGRDQAHAPNYTANIGLRGVLGEHWYWSVQTDLKDGYYFSNSHNQKAEAATQWHAQIGYRWDNWELKLWGRNLTDEDVEVRGFYFGNDPRDQYVTETYLQYGEPRRVGLTAEYQF
ncbi:hypothetical protein C5610_12240 [Idiomarina sp. OT37-5b]|jgi:outer membrane receptor protein involved in Fe transport|uniref:TonB-dependent receptor n=1 Tax=Idiomarina sp. OT37-5b TaxID=2100422 RepID=UPI000CF9C98D|nr:TonB-dependent receptor [Idiomarina sp. OT37-5b]AVJ56980.1 hypothetical protein C5610_12240 [Idiomarina sp. OT37-5b]